jgi:peptidoglycan/xylan/chitin deacetylase (PgdA/CDA1 family)
VLLYHSVCSDPAPLMREWAQAPARFREHLAYLRDAGYTTLTLSDYAGRLAAPVPDLPERLVVITFDDGFADFAEHAAPALAEHAMAATLYISTAYVGGRSTWLGPDGEQPMLSWAQVGELAAAGIEIGAHAHVHRALDELPLDDAKAEIAGSKTTLEEHLGPVVRSFAYPHGYHTRAIKDAVRAAGYQNAAGVKHALSGPGDDRFAIARIMLQGDVTTAALDRMMHGLGPAPRRERLQTKAWRTVRRARARRAAHEPVGHA